MNIYRVRVRCTCEAPKDLRRKGQSRKSVGAPTSIEDCLVEAADLSDAGQIGLNFIEGRASPSVRWLGFELMETARIQLPMVI